MAQRELETVGTYRFAHEALLAKSALEAFGIPAWVLGETLAGLHGGSLANAVGGGLRVMVRAAQADTAREILAGDHSAELDSSWEAGELCSHCGSADLVTEGSRKSAGVRRCLRCGHALPGE
jgi:hypothetical protein